MLYKKDTKQIFAESLIQLSRSRPIDKISVSAIVRNCGAGRQTFYNHFRDKYELINWFYISNADRIIAQNIGTKPWGLVIGRTLSFMFENQRFFWNAISEEGQLSFFSSFYEYTKNFYTGYVKANYGENALTKDLLFDIQFNCHGAVYMAREWLKSGMTESPEIIGTRIAGAMPESLKKFFK